MGKGASICFSRKQKINTKSSTETELVGVDDAMPTVLWSLYFIQEQGYDMTHALIYQDNKSAILLETNGKMSSSGRTKHIKAKFFFVAGKVELGEVVIEHKNTKLMWIDVNTKPKQGTPYKLDRSEIMNCPVDLPDETVPGTTRPVSALRPKKTKPRLQECVGVPSKVNGGKPSATGKHVTWPRQLAKTLVRAASTLV